MTDIKYEITDFNGKFKNGIVNLRLEVFVDEQMVPIELEIDDLDPKAIHYVALYNDDVVGTCRLIENEKILRMGRLAVKSSFRGKGIATKLMKMILIYAKKKKFEKVLLDSQVTVIPFYEKLGFHAFGDLFDDAGIDHKAMVLDLKK